MLIKIKEELSIYLNEALVALYLNMFILIRPILNKYTNISTLILFAMTALILGVSFVCNFLIKKKSLNNYKIKGIIYISLIIIILCIDIMFRYNYYMIKMAYDFIIYGLIPIILFTQIESINKFLEYYCYTCILVFIIYILDPFMGYPISKGYMTFGFSAMLPAFIGSYIMAKKNKKLFFKIIFITCILQIVFFANKGTILCMCTFIILYNLFLNKKDKFTIIKYFFVISLCYIALINLKEIVSKLINILNLNNYYSYSLNSLYKMLAEGNSGLSGREIIWSNAKTLIINKPILGNGIGLFESIYNGYSHNFLLDITMAYGVVGIYFSIIFFLVLVKKIAMAGNDAKTIYFVFFVLSIPKLMFSSYFFSEMSFWILLFITICGLPRQKSKI